MRYALYGIAGVYALLHMAAAMTQMKTAEKKDASAEMLLGGILWLAAIAAGWMHWELDWLAAVSGGVLILLAAWTNGKRSGRIHYSHHAVRLAVTALLITGFAIF